MHPLGPPPNTALLVTQQPCPANFLPLHQKEMNTDTRQLTAPTQSLCASGTLEVGRRGWNGEGMLQGHEPVHGRAGPCPAPDATALGQQGDADRWMRVFFQTYIHIVDRRTGKPVSTKFYTDSMVVFHHVNAYEEDGCLLFDVIAYEDSSLYQYFYLAHLKQNSKETFRAISVPSLKRFTVPLCVDKVMA